MEDDKHALLETVRERIESELDCPLKDSSSNLVFGKGNPNAPILFIGEAPGREEDLKGIPFVGAAGKELDKLLNSIGLALSDVYIANILKYRPPENRDPKPDEIARHTPYLIDQIMIIRPKIIATLGNFSTKFVLAKFDLSLMKKIGGISGLHGKPINISVRGLSFKVVPLYHPAAMLYRRQLKEVLEADFRLMGKIIGQKGGQRQEKDSSLDRFINR